MADAPAVILDPLSDEERAVLSRLRGKLQQKERRNKLRSMYYDGKQRLRDLGIAIPPHLKDLGTVVGWPAKAVDVLEQRLNMDGFVLPARSSLMDELADIDALNNMAVERSQAHVSALTHGTAFGFATVGDEGAGDPPIVYSVRSARQATAIYDRRRRRLSSALEVIAGERKNDRTEILYLPDVVITLERGKNGQWEVVGRASNPTKRVLCVPLIHRPFLEREFGMSRITRPVMEYTDTAVRTLVRTEVGAEFFNAPQRYALGADESAFKDKDGNVKTGWESILGMIWAVPDPEPDPDGDQEPRQVRVGQFPQQSMTPNIEHLRSVATMFAGETSIPVSYLGIIHDNPASADAINAGEADLIKVAERDHLTFGSAWVNLARLGIMARDGLDEVPEELTRLTAKWGDPSTPTKQAAAQTTMSLVSVGTYLPRSEITYERLGLDQATIDRLKLEDRELRAQQALQRLTEAAANASPRAQELSGQRPTGQPAEAAEPDQTA